MEEAEDPGLDGLEGTLEDVRPPGRHAGEHMELSMHNISRRHENQFWVLLAGFAVVEVICGGRWRAFERCGPRFLAILVNCSHISN